MEWANYLITVKDQIRNKKAKILVEDELNDHFQEQVKEYLNQGYNLEEAEDKSTIDMGDPVEVGTRLDRVHRPKLEGKLLLVTAFFGFFGLFVQYLLSKFCLSVDNSNYFSNQIMFSIIGISAMIVLYFLDYTILGRYSLLLWGSLYLIGICYLKFGYWHYAKLIYLFHLLYLFVPLYAGVLFQLRKWKIKGLFLSGIIGASPLLLAFYGNNSSGIIHYFIIIIIMLNIAVAKRWFGINRVIGFLCVWGSVLGSLMTCLFLRSSLMTGYQESRFLAIMTIGKSDELYLPNMVEKALVNSKMFGRDISMVQNLPVVDNDFVLVFIFNALGIFVGILTLGLLLILIIKAYKIAKRQRSYLGFMVGIACLLSLSVQIFFYCISNLVLSRIISIVPQQNLPFLSSGGSNVIYSYVLVGLLLSVHRNSEIINDRLIQSKRKRFFRKKEVV